MKLLIVHVDVVDLRCCITVVKGHLRCQQARILFRTNKVVCRDFEDFFKPRARPQQRTDWVEMTKSMYRSRGRLSLQSCCRRIVLGTYSNIRKGWEKRSAWGQLQAAILTPLCHSREICDLLYSSRSGEQKVKRDAFAGALITGDSGSGKSLIARYCAALASSRLPAVCLIEINCVSLIHKELGESERSVRRTFDLARAAAPCVLVLDGIEHIAPVRGKDNTTQGTMDRVLSTMLTEMDGIGGDASAMSKRVAVIGITTDVTWIDQALCRPGRLERCVQL